MCCLWNVRSSPIRLWVLWFSYLTINCYEMGGVYRKSLLPLYFCKSLFLISLGSTDLSGILFTISFVKFNLIFIRFVVVSLYTFMFRMRISIYISVCVLWHYDITTVHSVQIVIINLMFLFSSILLILVSFKNYLVVYFSSF